MLAAVLWRFPLVRLKRLDTTAAVASGCACTCACKASRLALRLSRVSIAPRPKCCQAHRDPRATAAAPAHISAFDGRAVIALARSGVRPPLP